MEGSLQDAEQKPPELGSDFCVQDAQLRIPGEISLLYKDMTATEESQ